MADTEAIRNRPNERQTDRQTARAEVGATPTNAGENIRNKGANSFVSRQSGACVAIYLECETKIEF